MRTWHKDPITIITRTVTGEDDYGAPTYSDTETATIGRVTTTDTVLEGDRPIEAYAVTLPYETRVTVEDRIRFTTPAGLTVTAAQAAPPKYHPSPHGFAASLVLTVKVVDSHG